MNKLALVLLASSAFLISTIASAAGQRADVNFPLATVYYDSNNDITDSESAVTTAYEVIDINEVSGVSNCLAFTELPDLNNPDAEPLTAATQASALSGNRTDPYVFQATSGEFPLPDLSALHATAISSNYPEYVELIQYNQICALHRDIEILSSVSTYGTCSLQGYLSEKSCNDNSGVWTSYGTPESYTPPSFEIKLQSLALDHLKVLLDAISGNPSDTNYQNEIGMGFDFKGIFDSKRLMLDESLSARELLCEAVRTGSDASILSFKETVIYSSNDVWFKSLTDLITSKSPASKFNEWQKYCKNPMMSKPTPMPEGKGSDAARTLYALGYKSIPQTRMDSLTPGSVMDGSYDTGVVESTLSSTIPTSHFAILSPSLPTPYLSTGIQNHPLNDKGENPHKFVYEQEPDFFKQQIYDDLSTASLDSNGDITSDFYSRIGTLSIPPNARGYVLKPNHQTDWTPPSGFLSCVLSPNSCKPPAPSFDNNNFSKLSTIIHSDKYIRSFGDTIENGNWNKSHPLWSEYLSPNSSADPTESPYAYSPFVNDFSLLQLYNKGFNWDGKECASSTDVGCKLAFSLYIHADDCAGFSFKPTTLDIITRQDDAKSKITLIDGSNVSSWQHYFQTSVEAACVLPTDSILKADLYFDLTYQEMRDTRFKYNLQGMGLLLPPAFFSPPTSTTIGSYDLAQMKMARYQKADNAGVVVNEVIISPDASSNQDITISTTTKYQTNSDYCPLGSTTTVENGQTFCELDACSESGLEFDSNTGMCIDQSTAEIDILCPDPSFTNSPIGKSKIQYDGKCVVEYEPQPSSNPSKSLPFVFDTIHPIYRRYVKNVDTWRPSGKKGAQDWKISGNSVSNKTTNSVSAITPPTALVTSDVYSKATFTGTFNYLVQQQEPWITETESRSEPSRADTCPGDDSKNAYNAMPVSECRDVVIIKQWSKTGWHRWSRTTTYYTEYKYRKLINNPLNYDIGFVFGHKATDSKFSSSDFSTLSDSVNLDGYPSFYKISYVQSKENPSLNGFHLGLFNGSSTLTRQSSSPSTSNPDYYPIARSTSSGILGGHLDVYPSGIIVSNISGDTSESGGTATFSISLDSAPSSTVSIAISSSDTSEGTVSSNSVSFSSSNWSTAQYITVTGTNDSLIDGDISYSIITAPSVSSDNDFNDINPNDVFIINTDNEAQTALSSDLSYSMPNGSFTIKDQAGQVIAQVSDLNATMQLNDSTFTGTIDLTPSSTLGNDTSWSFGSSIATLDLANSLLKIDTSLSWDYTPPTGDPVTEIDRLPSASISSLELLFDVVVGVDSIVITPKSSKIDSDGDGILDKCELVDDDNDILTPEKNDCETFEGYSIEYSAIAQNANVAPPAISYQSPQPVSAVPVTYDYRLDISDSKIYFEIAGNVIFDLSISSAGNITTNNVASVVDPSYKFNKDIIFERNRFTDDYMLHNGRFGFFNSTQTKGTYSRPAVSNFDIYDCEPSHFKIKNSFYNLPTRYCSVINTIDCDSSSSVQGLSLLYINDIYSCGKATSNCSIADIPAFYDDSGTSSYKTCKYLAVEDTSIDVLKDVTDKVFYSKFLKNVAIDDGLKPLLLNNSIISSETAIMLNDYISDSSSGNLFAYDDNGDFANLNKLFSRINTSNASELKHVSDTYYSSPEESPSIFLNIIGFPKEKLPNFKVDTLSVSYTIKARVIRDLQLIPTTTFSCLPFEHELVKLPNNSTPTHIICVNIIPQIKGVTSHEWDPFQDEQFVPFVINTTNASSSIVLSSHTKLVLNIPDSNNFRVYSSNSAKQVLIKSILEAEAILEPSIVKSAITCADGYDVNIDQTIITNHDDEQSGTTLGSIRCLISLKSGFSRSSNTPFISSAETSFDEDLADSPPVELSLGELTRNTLLDNCSTSLSDLSILASPILSFEKRQDAVSKQWIEFSDDLSQDPVIYMPTKSTSSYIKKSILNDEILNRISILLGTASITSENQLLVDPGNNDQVIFEGQDGVLTKYITDSARSSLAKSLFIAIESSFPTPVNNSKLVITQDMFKDDGLITGFSEDLFNNTTSIDEISGIIHTSSMDIHMPPEPADGLVITSNSLNVNSFGLLLDTSILSSSNDSISIEVKDNNLILTKPSFSKVLSSDSALNEVFSDKCTHLSAQQSLGEFHDDFQIGDNFITQTLGSDTSQIHLDDIFWSTGLCSDRDYINENDCVSSLNTWDNEPLNTYSYFGKTTEHKLILKSFAFTSDNTAINAIGNTVSNTITFNNPDTVDALITLSFSSPDTSSFNAYINGSLHSGLSTGYTFNASPGLNTFTIVTSDTEVSATYSITSMPEFALTSNKGSSITSIDTLIKTHPFDTTLQFLFSKNTGDATSPINVKIDNLEYTIQPNGIVYNIIPSKNHRITMNLDDGLTYLEIKTANPVPHIVSNNRFDLSTKDPSGNYLFDNFYNYSIATTYQANANGSACVPQVHGDCLIDSINVDYSIFATSHSDVQFSKVGANDLNVLFDSYNYSVLIHNDTVNDTVTRNSCDNLYGVPEIDIVATLLSQPGVSENYENCSPVNLGQCPQSTDPNASNYYDTSGISEWLLINPIKVSVVNSTAIFTPPSYSLPLPNDFQYSDMSRFVRDDTVLDFANCTAADLLFYDSQLSCNYNNASSIGFNQLALLDKDGLPLFYFEVANTSISINHLKSQSFATDLVEFGYKDWALSGDFLVEELDKSMWKTQQLPLNDLLTTLETITRANPELMIKIFPNGFAKSRGIIKSNSLLIDIPSSICSKSDEKSESSCIIAGGTWSAIDAKANLEIGQAISEARELCVGVSLFSDEVYNEIRQKSRFYNLLRHHVNLDSLSDIVMGVNKNNIPSSIESRDASERIGFIGWKGTSRGDIEQSLKAENFSGQSLFNYLSGVCASGGDWREQSGANFMLDSTTHLCDLIVESGQNKTFLFKDYSFIDTDIGIEFTMKNFLTMAEFDIPVSGYEKSLSPISGLVGTIGTVDMWIMRDHIYKVNSKRNIGSQVLSGLSFHEKLFVEQMSGAINMDNIQRCVSDIGQTGFYKLSNDTMSYSKVLSPNSPYLRNFYPPIANISPTEYEERDSNGSHIYNPINISNYDDSVDNQVRFSFTSTSLLDADDSIKFCNNFISSKVMVGHPSGLANASSIEGSFVSLTGEQKVSVERVSSGSVFEDSKNNPNWLQDKACKSSFQTVNLQLDKSKLDSDPKTCGISGAEPCCDGGLYSGLCVQQPIPDFGILDLIFSYGSVKRSINDYAENSILKTVKVCGVEDAPVGTEMATPTDFKAKTIMVQLPTRGTGNIPVVENNIIINKHDTDKAKTSLQLISPVSSSDYSVSDPLYPKTLLINSINLFQAITQKKTGESRSIKTDYDDSQFIPQISINEESEIEQIINLCMAMKGEFEYTKVEAVGNLQYNSASTLVKVYPNKDMDFEFVDPRSPTCSIPEHISKDLCLSDNGQWQGQTRSVRRCSDIFLESDSTLDSADTCFNNPEKTKSECRVALKAAYVKQFKIDNQLSLEFDEQTYANKLAKIQTSSIISDGGSTATNEIDDSGQFIFEIGRGKSSGTSSLQNEQLINSTLQGPGDIESDDILSSENAESAGGLAGTSGSPLSKLTAGLALASSVLSNLESIQNVLGGGTSVLSGVSDTVAGASEFIDTAAKVTGALAVVSFIKDLTSGNSSSGDLQKLQANETSTNEYMSLIERDACISDSNCEQKLKSAEDIVDKVMSFDRKMDARSQFNPADESLDAQLLEQERELSEARANYEDSDLSRQSLNALDAYNKNLSDNPNNTTFRQSETSFISKSVKEYNDSVNTFESGDYSTAQSDYYSAKETMVSGAEDDIFAKSKARRLLDTQKSGRDSSSYEATSSLAEFSKKSDAGTSASDNNVKAIFGEFTSDDFCDSSLTPEENLACLEKSIKDSRFGEFEVNNFNLNSQ